MSFNRNPYLSIINFLKVNFFNEDNCLQFSYERNACI